MRAKTTRHDMSRMSAGNSSTLRKAMRLRRIELGDRPASMKYEAFKAPNKRKLAQQKKKIGLIDRAIGMVTNGIDVATGAIAALRSLFK